MRGRRLHHAHGADRRDVARFGVRAEHRVRAHDAGARGAADVPRDAGRAVPRRQDAVRGHPARAHHRVLRGDRAGLVRHEPAAVGFGRAVLRRPAGRRRGRVPPQHARLPRPVPLRLDLLHEGRPRAEARARAPRARDDGARAQGEGGGAREEARLALRQGQEAEEPRGQARRGRRRRGGQAEDPRRRRRAEGAAAAERRARAPRVPVAELPRAERDARPEGAAQGHPRGLLREQRQGAARRHRGPLRQEAAGPPPADDFQRPGAGEPAARAVQGAAAVPRSSGAASSTRCGRSSS